MDEKIEKRLEQLKAIGAGDEQCSDCMSIGGVPVMATCKQCIADTPAFTELIGRLMTNSRAAAALAQGMTDAQG